MQTDIENVPGVTIVHRSREDIVTVVMKNVSDKVTLCRFGIVKSKASTFPLDFKVVAFVGKYGEGLVRLVGESEDYSIAHLIRVQVVTSYIVTAARKKAETYNPRTPYADNIERLAQQYVQGLTLERD